MYDTYQYNIRTTLTLLQVRYKDRVSRELSRVIQDFVGDTVLFDGYLRAASRLNAKRSFAKQFFQEK